MWKYFFKECYFEENENVPYAQRHKSGYNEKLYIKQKILKKSQFDEQKRIKRLSLLE